MIALPAWRFQDAMIVPLETWAEVLWIENFCAAVSSGVDAVWRLAGTGTARLGARLEGGSCVARRRSAES